VGQQAWSEEADELRPHQSKEKNHMPDVLFPKRGPRPGELDIRPIPSDYRPKRVRLLEGSEVEGYHDTDLSDQDDAEVAMDFSGQLRLPKPVDQSSHNRLNEIAALVRALTYGEMIELAQAIWKIRPEGEDVNQHSLPMMLHLWSTSPEHH